VYAAKIEGNMPQSRKGRSVYLKSIVSFASSVCPGEDMSTGKTCEAYADSIAVLAAEG